MMTAKSFDCRSSLTTGVIHRNVLHLVVYVLISFLSGNEIAENQICENFLFVVQNGLIKENNITFTTSEWTVYKQAATEIMHGLACILIAAACPEVDSGLLREKKKRYK